MSGTAGDDLLASDADEVRDISNSDRLEHLAGSVGFHVEAHEPDRLPCFLASADATLSDQVEATQSGRRRRLPASVEVTPAPEVSDPEGLEHLGGTVGLQGDSITGSDRLPRLLASPDANLPEVRDPYGLGHLAGMLAFHVEATTDNYHLLTAADLKTNLTISEAEDGAQSSLGDVFMFPDMIRSQLVISEEFRMLMLLSYVDCKEEFHAFAYTCKSWYLASSLYPRPLLLHPFACPTWLFVTPGGKCNNAVDNFRLFPALRMEEHSTLIGGSTKFLIFVDQSVCSIINIHTGNRTELLVPCLGVKRGVLSAPADCANSKILLVTGTSVLCKSVNGTDEWRVQDFGDMRVGPIDDIVFVGETVYMIDNRSSLFIITPALEIIFRELVEFHVLDAPRGLRAAAAQRRFGRGIGSSDRPKKVLRKNWLLEHHGQLLRMSLMSFTLDTEVRSGFFMSRIGSHDMHHWLTNKFPGKKWCSEEWIEMGSADLGDSCLFLNSGTCVTPFVADNPGRWGLDSGQVFVCGPEIFPWLSFDLGWAREGDVIPENIRWPCPVFMDSAFSFTAAEELDHGILRDKASEPTASSGGTLPSEARDLSFNEEAN